MTKEELLKLLLEFQERKRKLWFTKEEFFVWLWLKGYKMRFETVARYLRKLANEGLIVKRYRYDNSYPFVRYVEYHVNRYRIRMALRR